MDINGDPMSIHQADVSATECKTDATGTRAFEFSNYTGKNVRVAVIDSGIASEENRGFKVEEGVKIYRDQYDHIRYDECVTDAIGHGTACAGIIAGKAPGASIVPVKIFDEQLETDFDLFEAAIEWCSKKSIRVINLSLGTTENTNIQRLEKVCRLAHNRGIILVAAENNRRQRSFPATFSFVLGVTAGSIRQKYGYHYREYHSVEFVARGDKQRLAWTEPKFVFLGGTSFAAPHISALVCLILEAFPEADVSRVRKILARKGLASPPVLVDTQRLYTVDRLIHEKRLEENHTLARMSLTRRSDWITKAALYPYSKEMHALIRYRDLVSFDISSVVDVPGRMTIGKDAGSLIGIDSSDLAVTSDLNSALAESDTVIIGYVDKLSAIRRRNLLLECCTEALDKGCHIFSFLPLRGREYREIYKTAADKGLRIESPIVSFSDYQEIMGIASDPVSVKTPVVSIFGTGPSQGKFTTQLCLRRWLKFAGYAVVQIGTEHHGSLFGFDYTLPIGYGGEESVQISMNQYIPLLQSVMRIMDAKEPDIIIVGAQSGVIPHDFGNLSQCYTLPSIAFLLGTLPDGYVLVVNSVDEEEYIQDTINVLRGIGKGDLIALVFGDMKKNVSADLKNTVISCEKLSEIEILQTTQRLEARFQVPATEVVSRQGQLKLLKSVIDFFADDSVPYTTAEQH
jgi:uncharacterized NAD-dependent epimerase/dehydratase family protein